MSAALSEMVSVKYPLVLTEKRSTISLKLQVKNKLMLDIQMLMIKQLVSCSDVIERNSLQSVVKVAVNDNSTLIPATECHGIPHTE